MTEGVARGVPTSEVGGGRPLPNFLGIGVPRAGTTWLHQLLQAHPDVFVPSRRKEVSYFNLRYDRGFAWYRKFFPPEAEVQRYRAVGEVTPYYFYCTHCPERIAGAGVERLVLMLRHPVDRAWSYYGQKIRNGMFRGSFEEFLEHSRWPVVEQGHYSRYLRRYLEHFDRQQILILLFETSVADVAATQRELAAFLGISASGFPGEDAGGVVNQSYMTRAPRLYGLAFRLGRFFRKYDLDWVVNTAKRLGIREAFGAAGKLAPMRPETRARLDRLFQPEIEELEQVAGISLDLWRRSPAGAVERGGTGAEANSSPSSG
jgi:hypothetical protein